MSKPMHADRWYETPNVDELRQEFQKVYETLDAEVGGIDLSGYYTRTEVDNLVASLDYYTTSEVDTLLSNKSDVGHTHDSRYYTESEVDALISAAAFDPDDIVVFGWVGDVAGQTRVLIAGDDESDDLLLEIRSDSGATPGSSLTSADRKFAVWGDGRVYIAQGVVAGSGDFSGNLTVSKNAAWITADSSSSGSNTNEQTAGISIGESGYQGSAAVHLTYTGDGYAHLGMGSVSGGVPANRAMKFFYLNNDVDFYGNLIIPSTIYHSGDTNTYIQFHTTDQWRVVTGGGERLEVQINNTYVRNTLNAVGGLILPIK